MKAYKGSFKKKDGTIREMLFAKLDELPESVIEARIIGSGSEKQYPEGMKLIWDLEEDNFRVFNYNTVQGEIKKLTVDESEYF